MTVAVQVTSFGTPTMVRATSGSVTGSWGSGQNRTAGHLLVAAVSAGGSTASAAALSTPSGWTQQAVTSNVATTANAWVAFYTKVAAGSDSAPAFTATLSGTAAMTCTLFELAAANDLSPVDTSGTYSSGGTAGTLTLTATTAGNVSVAGEFAITCFSMERAAGTNTWTPGSGWANAANDGSTSTVLHTAVDYYSNPASGSALAETGSWSTETTAYGAGVILVVGAQAGALELYTDSAATTITTGGTDTPAAGTPELWTAASWSGFPTASPVITPPTTFHIADPAAGASGELIQVINTATGLVIRGAEGTSPVAHTSGFTVRNVIPAGQLGKRVYDVRSLTFGAKGDGATDDYAAIQAALTSCRIAGGGIVYIPEGTYLSSQILQIGSNTVLRGAGISATTLRANWPGGGPAQVGSVPGPAILTTYGYAACSSITVTGISFDGNQLNLTSGFLPSWWGGHNEACPILLGFCTGLALDGIQVINAIGYSMWILDCNDSRVTHCKIVSGTTSSTGWNQQDGIHVTGGQRFLIDGNDVDTGDISGVGDDAIAVQSLATSDPCTDFVISNNRIRGGADAINLVLGGGTITNVEITGNDIWGSQTNGILIGPDATGGTIVSNVSITGNTLSGVCQSGGSVFYIADYQAVSSTGAGWADIAIVGNTVSGVTGDSNGIFAGQGTGLAINDNVFDGMNIAVGMQIGNTASGGLTHYQVNNNIINMASTTQSDPTGIVVIDSQDGTIQGNVITGPGSGVSGGIGIGLYCDSGTDLVTGCVVSANRVTAWASGITEINSGGQPDYNTISGNNLHGCATWTATSGAHTCVGGQKLIQITSSFTSATGTGSQSVTNLVASLDIGSYYLEITIPYLPAGTVGSHQTWGFSAGGSLALSAISMASLIMAGNSTAEAGTSALVTSTTLADNMWTGPTNAATAGYGMARFWGTLTVSTAGTLQVVVADATSGDEVTVAAGATMLVRPLN